MKSNNGTNNGFSGATSISYPKAYDLGGMFSRGGRGLDMNPYAEGTEGHAGFIRGWKAAQAVKLARTQFHASSNGVHS